MHVSDYLRRHGRLVAAALLLVGATGRAGAQQPAGQPQIRINAVELHIGGRVQTQFNTTSVDEVPATEWLIRRARLETAVKLNDFVSGKLEAEFGKGRTELKDAYVAFTFSPAARLVAGKQYRPFGRLIQVSSKRILPIERAASIRGISALDHESFVETLGYGDRDIGLTLVGEPAGAPAGFTYALGVFQGPLAGELEREDSRQFAARATISPTKELQLGLGWSSRQFEGAERPDGGVELERGHAVEFDFEWGHFDPGLHLLGEVVAGTLSPVLGDNFVGAQLWAGYRVPRAGPALTFVEPIFRVSYGTVDEGRPVVPAAELGGTLVTPGINFYFGALNRMMFNYDVWFPRGADESVQSFKAMFQLAF